MNVLKFKRRVVLGKRNGYCPLVVCMEKGRKPRLILCPSDISFDGPVQLRRWAQAIIDMVDANARRVLELERHARLRA